MAAIVITCPECGRVHPTGIQTDKASFDCIPFFVAHIECPYCARIYAWAKPDARLVQNLPPDQWIENLRSNPAGAALRTAGSGAVKSLLPVAFENNSFRSDRAP
jgi:hypothetical protein